jgi:hypothetical protein
MMRTPTEVELSQLIHGYDKAGAHQYYLRVHKANGRKPSGSVVSARRHEGVRAEQKQELAHNIQNLEHRLQKLESLIHTRELEEAKVNRKSKAKKERAAKERDKPITAAEKAKTARALRTRKPELIHEQVRKQSNSKKYSVSELKSLAIKVKGQLAVANQKLAAL